MTFSDLKFDRQLAHSRFNREAAHTFQNGYSVRIVHAAYTNDLEHGSFEVTVTKGDEVVGIPAAFTGAEALEGELGRVEGLAA